MVKRNRLVMVSLSVLVLLVLLGVVHYQTHQLQEDVAAGRASGDCGSALAAEGRVGVRHRLVTASAVIKLRHDTEVCHQLEGVAETLDDGLAGNLGALQSGFATMSTALAEPGNEATAGATLDAFLGKLPLKMQPCETLTVTDWLLTRKAGAAVLDRALNTAKTLTPKAIDGGTVAYCETPARYSGAPAPHKGINRTNLIDLSGLAMDDRVPHQWLTTTATQTVFVICTDTKESGPAVRSCPYHSTTGPSSSGTVTFREIAIPVKVYELRTGRVVVDRKILVGGARCPSSFTDYATNGRPPANQLVEPAGTDVQAAVRPLIR